MHPDLCGRRGIAKQTRTDKGGTHAMREARSVHMPAVHMCRARGLKFLTTANGFRLGGKMGAMMKNFGAIQPGVLPLLLVTVCLSWSSVTFCHPGLAVTFCKLAAGMPDLLIFNHGNDGDHMAFGLAVELKAKKSAQARKEQKEWLDKFASVMGWR